MIAALPASGGTQGGPVPLSARGTGAISGANLEAKRISTRAVVTAGTRSPQGPGGLDRRGSTGQQECRRWVSGGALQAGSLPTQRPRSCDKGVGKPAGLTDSPQQTPLPVTAETGTCKLK